MNESELEKKYHARMYFPVLAVELKILPFLSVKQNVVAITFCTVDLCLL